MQGVGVLGGVRWVGDRGEGLEGHGVVFFYLGEWFCTDFFWCFAWRSAFVVLVGLMSY